MLEGELKVALFRKLPAFLLFLLLENKALGKGGSSWVGWAAGQGLAEAAPPGDFRGISALPGLQQLKSVIY